MRHCPAEVFGLRTAKTTQTTQLIINSSAMITNTTTRPTKPPLSLPDFLTRVIAHSDCELIGYRDTHTHSNM